MSQKINDYLLRISIWSKKNTDTDTDGLWSQKVNWI